jgi:hypothetical protein
VTFQRPISPREAARIEARDGARLPALSVRDVLGRSFGVVRQRWPALALLTFGLGYAPDLVVHLTTQIQYGHGSQYAVATVLYWTRAVSFALVLQFSRSTVVAASLGSSRSLLGAVGSVLRSSPSLLMIWIAVSYDVVWSYAWSFPLRRLLKTDGMMGAEVLTLILVINVLVPFASALLAVAMIGLVTPVIISEHRKPISAIGRAWRLLRGSRWKLLAMYLLILAAETAIGFLEARVRQAYRADVHNGAYLTVLWAFTALVDVFEAFWAVVLASTYLELRQLREGAPHDQVAELFG